MLTESEEKLQRGLIREGILDLIKRGSKFAILFAILKKLTTRFSSWKAYKLGIIDADGNVLKSRDQRKTQPEKNAFTMLDLFCLNLKKTLERIPGNKNSLMTLAGSLYLMKEHEENRIDDLHLEILEERFYNYIETDEKFSPIFLEEIGMAGGGAAGPVSTNTTGNLPNMVGVVPKKKKKKKKKTKMVRRSYK